MIAKRCVALSKTYMVMGVVLSLVGVFFVSLSGLFGIPTPAGGPAAGGATAPVDPSIAVPFVGVSFQAMAAALFTTPVMMLFVYDKNNGVLEYLLSLGMNQRDIYMQYLKAALALSAAIVAFDVVLDNAVGLAVGALSSTLGISALVVALAPAAVAFGTMLMMSFSSLQKQRMGANQPLGQAVGVLVILPSYLLPLTMPSIAFWIDLGIAALALGLAAVTYFATSRLVSREKLLP